MIYIIYFNIYYDIINFLCSRYCEMSNISLLFVKITLCHFLSCFAHRCLISIKTLITFICENAPKALFMFVTSLENQNFWIHIAAGFEVYLCQMGQPPRNPFSQLEFDEANRKDGSVEGEEDEEGKSADEVVRELGRQCLRQEARLQTVTFVFGGI